MSTIIVTGCCGLLGQKMVKSLKGHSVVGFDLLDSHVEPKLKLEYRNTDISDQDDLEAAIAIYKPDLIINCAGITDVDGCEKNKALAYMGNVKGVESLVDICNERGIKLIQLSTDYVFDGQNGPYAEDAQPNPLGYYGVTKLNAENLITEALTNYMIVRTNVLFGIGIDTRPNFVTWVISKLQLGKPLRVVNDQFNNPTLADNLADAIAELIALDYNGIIHFGGKDYVSRYNFARSIARTFSLDPALITSLLTEEIGQMAPRPERGGVKTDKAEELLETKPLTIKEALKKIKEQFELQPAKQ